MLPPNGLPEAGPEPSKSQGYVLTQLSALHRWMATSADGPLPREGGLHQAVVAACQALEEVVQAPFRVLADLDSEEGDARLDEIGPLRVSPADEAVLNAIARSGLAEALGSGQVHPEQVFWIFTRPAALRRLVNAKIDAELASMPPKPKVINEPLTGPSALATGRKDLPHPKKPVMLAASALLGLGCVILGLGCVLEANQIRALREALYDLRRRIDSSGLPTAIVPDDPNKPFRVKGHNRIEVSGTFNPRFIKELTLLGLNPNDGAVSLYKGAEEPNPQGEPTRFSYQSPPLPLTGEPIAPTLNVVPYPEVVRLFPEHFPPNKLQYSQNFLLAAGGIQADPELLTISSPRDGEAVERYCQLDGLIGVKEGYPVVFIKPPGNSWWVQDPAMVSEGAFSVNLNVGDGMSPVGTRFRIVVCLTRSKEEALKFKPGTQMSSLPPGLVRSNPITVIRR